MDPVCEIDERGYCPRHKAIHAGRLRALALAETEEGERFRLYQDRVTSGELWPRPSAPQPVIVATGAPSVRLAPARRPAGGPGTELKAILAGLGLEACLGCLLYAEQMDVWGAQGCRERRAEIVERLKAKAAERGLLAKLAAKASAGVLVDLAIRRAEEKAEAKQAAAAAPAGN